MRYSSQILDKIRNFFRISEVVGRRIPIKKHGREYIGLCPFHDEKTPSFTVNDAKGFYHCFGCSAHGDVIGFVKEFDNISFKEAIELLANEANIELPKPSFSEKAYNKQSRENNNRPSLYDIMEMAAKFYCHQLNTSIGADARKYLRERGLSHQTIEHFHIGFAPAGSFDDDSGSLKKELLKAGIAENDMLTCGLLTKNDRGESYDKFRNRVTFPILDAKGRVIAFGGRLLSNTSSKAPKYLNSPETPIFHKGSIVYNLKLAREAVYLCNRESRRRGDESEASEIIVAEGYMDVIALSQAGIRNVVAPLGTSITAEQLMLLWGIADEPIICLDGDKAGVRAMARVAETALPLLRAGKSLRFCMLPDGEDPDSIVNKYGAVEMRKLLDASIYLVDVIWNNNYLSHKLSTPEQRAKAEAELMHIIGRISDKNVAAQYRKEMKSRIWRMERKTISDDRRHSAASSNSDILLSRLPTRVGSHEKQYEAQLEECYRNFITAILLYPSLLAMESVEDLLMKVQFRNGEMRMLCSSIIERVLPAAIEADNDDRKGTNIYSLTELLSKAGTLDVAQKLIKKAKSDVNFRRLFDDEAGFDYAKEFISILQNRIQQILLAKEHSLALQNIDKLDAQDKQELEFERFLQINRETALQFYREDMYGDDDS